MLQNTSSEEQKNVRKSYIKKIKCQDGNFSKHKATESEPKTAESRRNSCGKMFYMFSELKCFLLEFFQIQILAQ
jgi:hypothetical protein